MSSPAPTPRPTSTKRFPAKQTKRVHNGLHPRSIDAFLRGLT